MEKTTCRESTLAARGGRAGISWRKSSHSNPQGACVEVAEASGQVWFRDSKTADGPVIMVSMALTAAFVTAVARGQV
ncbi:DUF397 domain-containing protein [Streptomyces sp. NPDC056716]|uniref:DUF397 domain-containing protein n=1 Tax=unclassified Streptomyces TaxID=2593676 RepID=UPI0036D068C7